MKLNELTNTKGKFDGKKLGNISGYYKVNDKKYFHISKGFNENYKKPYNIVIADNANYIFVNHRDYSVWATEYNIINNCYEFNYNGETYSIPLNPVFNESINDYVVKITKKE